MPKKKKKTIWLIYGEQAEGAKVEAKPSWKAGAGSRQKVMAVGTQVEVVRSQWILNMTFELNEGNDK